MRLSIALILILLASPAKAQWFEGTARVIDGDTLDLSGKRIRLFGIDAPESKQPCTWNGKPWDCGKDAKEALVEKIGDQQVRCQQRDIDRYKRIVGVCFIGDLDLNDWMVRNGWAVAYRSFSKDYVPAEAQASKEKAGIWKSRFEKPWDWRRKN